MKKNLSRRDFLKISGGVVGAGIMTSALFTAFSRFKTKDSTFQSAGKSLSKWCMVIDLRKCEGLLRCTQACIDVHFVPKPQKWIEVFMVNTGKGGSYHMPTPCYHCENAPCVKACPVKATYHNEEGLVLVDHTRCIGCRLCMAACPYERRFFNWGTPVIPAKAAFAKYSPDFPVPAKKGTVMKCVFCSHLLKEGKLPACVSGCPNGALYMGDLNRDMASNGLEVVKLAKFLDENNAYRYKEELGTQPRVWYLPGHGEAVGRDPYDHKEVKPIVWPESGA
jgi:molybdopterin-containing oxidoreductase family iron-sulfur binding subunit